MITYRTAESYFQLCRINRETPSVAGLVDYACPRRYSYGPNVHNGQRIVLRVPK